MAATPSNLDEWLSVSEAARVLGVAPATVGRLGISSYKTHLGLLYNPKAVEALREVREAKLSKAHQEAREAADAEHAALLDGARA